MFGLWMRKLWCVISDAEAKANESYVSEKSFIKPGLQEKFEDFIKKIGKKTRLRKPKHNNYSRHSAK